MVSVPPLCERKDDIPLLVDFFLEKHAVGVNKKILSKQAMDILLDYKWPGNVRELANALERAVLVSFDRLKITAEDLPLNMVHVMPCIPKKTKKGSTHDTLRLDMMEREHIERVLEFANGNKSKAARLLGISRKKLYQKIEEGLK